MPRLSRLAAPVAALLLAACAHTPPDDPSDPLETVNRGMFAFNRTADRYVARPIAKGYDKVMPGPARTSVRNFFSNLFYPTVILNDLLQAKFEQGSRDFCRFVLNSTFGIGGLFDVASRGGLTENDEDFCQTIGYWGFGPGWYLMLPILGPSDNRDLVGKGGDYGTNPLIYVNDSYTAWGLGILDKIDERAGLLSADKFLDQQLDPYVFVRTIYLQSRQNKVYDGNPPKEDWELPEDDSGSSDEPAQQPQP